MIAYDPSSGYHAACVVGVFFSAASELEREHVTFDDVGVLPTREINGCTLELHFEDDGGPLIKAHLITPHAEMVLVPTGTVFAGGFPRYKHESYVILD